jgi:hypothetical protein
MNRSEEQKKQYQRALTEKFMFSMRDKAKLEILGYMEQNPFWTPEELKTIVNYYSRKYGLHNRYVASVPKQFADGLEGKVENGTDTPGTQSTTV